MPGIPKADDLISRQGFLIDRLEPALVPSMGLSSQKHYFLNGSICLEKSRALT